MGGRRTVTVFGAALVAMLAVSGAVSYACTNLATLNLSSNAGKSGDTITVTGSSYRMPTDTQTGVQIRWNGLDGPVLAEVRPDRTGNISATFTVPEAAPDNYVVLAVLKNGRGVDTSGTPARAQFQILGASGRPVPQQPPSAPAPVATGDGGGSAAPIALLVVLGAAGIGLFGAGLVAVARQGRRRELPAPTPARRH
jgi:hypothetical protein